MVIKSERVVSKTQAKSSGSTSQQKKAATPKKERVAVAEPERKTEAAGSILSDVKHSRPGENEPKVEALAFSASCIDLSPEDGLVPIYYAQAENVPMVHVLNTAALRLFDAINLHAPLAVSLGHIETECWENNDRFRNAFEGACSVNYIRSTLSVVSLIEVVHAAVSVSDMWAELIAAYFVERPMTNGEVSTASSSVLLLNFMMNRACSIHENGSDSASDVSSIFRALDVNPSFEEDFRDRFSEGIVNDASNISDLIMNMTRSLQYMFNVVSVIHNRQIAMYGLADVEPIRGYDI